MITGLLLTIFWQKPSIADSEPAWCNGLSEQIISSALKKWCRNATLEEVKNISSAQIRIDETRLPDGNLQYLNSLRNLDITLNNKSIKKITKNFIYNAPHIEQLKIGSTDLEDIEEEAFASIPNVQSVSIESLWHIKEIPERLFANNPNLEKISISVSENSSLKKLPKNVFFKIV